METDSRKRMRRFRHLRTLLALAIPEQAELVQLASWLRELDDLIAFSVSEFYYELDLAEIVSAGEFNGSRRAFEIESRLKVRGPNA